MPSYTFTNSKAAKKYYVASVWTLKDVTKLVNAVGSVKFFYADSRNAAVDAIDKFREAGRPGIEVVNTAKQFPEEPLYFECGDDLAAILAALQGCLNWKDDNVAKDTTVHKSIRAPGDKDQGTADQPKFLGQSAQDSAKRFEVQVVRLTNYKLQSAVFREDFEDETGATWA